MKNILTVLAFLLLVSDASAQSETKNYKIVHRGDTMNVVYLPFVSPDTGIRNLFDTIYAQQDLYDYGVIIKDLNILSAEFSVDEFNQSDHTAADTQKLVLALDTVFQELTIVVSAMTEKARLILKNQQILHNYYGAEPSTKYLQIWISNYFGPVFMEMAPYDEGHRKLEENYYRNKIFLCDPFGSQSE